MDPKKKVSAVLDEFKNFALKGNVVDLAIGVIIGAAFGKIIDSIVKHIIMPAISVIMPGEQGYLAWKWVINGKEIPYGLYYWRNRQLSDCCAGFVYLHCQIPGHDYEEQTGRNGGTASSDKGPATAHRNS